MDDCLVATFYHLVSLFIAVLTSIAGLLPLVIIVFVGTIHPWTIATFHPQAIGTFHSQAIGTFRHQAIGTFRPQAIGTFHPRSCCPFPSAFIPLSLFVTFLFSFLSATIAPFRHRYVATFYHRSRTIANFYDFAMPLFITGTFHRR
jgi:hypothetical protein